MLQDVLTTQRKVDVNLDERHAIHEYTENSFEDTNKLLRGEELSESRQRDGMKLIPRITSAIEKAKLSQPAMLYRGLKGYGVAKKFLEDHPVGSTFTEDAFGSTSMKEDYAKCFTGAYSMNSEGDVDFRDTEDQYEKDIFGILMSIHAPKGTQALWVDRFISHGEAEFVLQRGTSFRITAHTKDDNGVDVVEMEVVSQTPKKLEEPTATADEGFSASAVTPTILTDSKKEQDHTSMVNDALKEHGLPLSNFSAEGTFTLVKAMMQQPTFQRQLRDKVAAHGDIVTRSEEDSDNSRVQYVGMPIRLENDVYTVRTGTSEGKEWATTMLCAYGFLERTTAADGEGIDVYLHPSMKATPDVYVVHQQNPQTKEYDEDKVLLGFSSPESALRAYLAHYDRPDYYRSMTILPLNTFKQVVASGGAGVHWKKKGQQPHRDAIFSAPIDSFRNTFASFKEEEHPRGNKNNKGQFVKKDAMEKLSDTRLEREHPEHVKAVTSYTGHKFDHINRRLRGNSPVDKKIVGALDALFAERVLKSPITTYRGVNAPPKALMNLKVGDVFADKGYTSTSSSKRIASEFAGAESVWAEEEDDEGGIIFEMSVPKGHSAIRFGLGLGALHDEQEVLLPRNSIFKVESVEPLRRGSKYKKIKLSVVSIKGKDTFSADDGMMFAVWEEPEHPRNTDGTFKVKNAPDTGGNAGGYENPQKSSRTKKGVLRPIKRPGTQPNPVSSGSGPIPDGFITPKGQKWADSYRKVKSKGKKPKKLPFKDSELPDPPKTWNGSKVKLYRLPDGQWPDWFTSLVKKGEVGGPMPQHSKIAWAEHYPNDEGLLYVYANNTDQGTAQKKLIARRDDAYKARQDKQKFAIVRDFHAKYHKIEADVLNDLKSGKKKVRDTAACFYTQMACGLRADAKGGGFVSAREVGTGKKKKTVEGYHSFGVSSLQRRHLSLTKDGKIKIEFTGKAGKTNVRLISNDVSDDWTMARLSVQKTVKKMMANKGAEFEVTEDEERAFETLKSNTLYHPNIFNELKQRMSAVKDPKGKLFDIEYSDLLEYCNATGKQHDLPDGFRPHNLRHHIATERGKDAKLCALYDWGKMPENLKEYTQMKNFIGEVAGDFVNDTVSAYTNNYLDPEVMRDLQKAAGVECEGVTPKSLKKLPIIKVK